MFRDWISAFRPRTLFLAVASVILGSGLAWHVGKFETAVFVLALLLAVLLQTLANLANDLGDYQHGTDVTGHREGPERAVQSGRISEKQMKTAVVAVIVLSALTGVSLLAVAAKNISRTYLFALLLFGVLSILAALFYTLGKKPYGYYGLGDFAAFFFFGPVPVAGVYLLHVHLIDFQPILPAVGLGLVSTMILNVNNMRDIENDIASGKNTFASRIGLTKAKVYHALMQIILTACFLGYSFMFAIEPWYRFVYVIVFVFQFNILIKILKSPGGRSLDPYLKLTSISGLLLAVFFSLCICAGCE
ncbi:MAG: 1,4-dihydroxy-2-naphthoate octaprenyltransferase [Dysgonamonadaceae bacterium]|jgi:1,4-dihydroxy-2-naphthoate octaprenyltransferase|nr:1,4-dihydroxy-2-naphthoate octaprenyltransferase [Dysgonamonadaceae bacterium]